MRCAAPGDIAAFPLGHELTSREAEDFASPCRGLARLPAGVSLLPAAGHAGRRPAPQRAALLKLPEFSHFPCLSTRWEEEPKLSVS